jgi:hypothetical protein
MEMARSLVPPLKLSIYFQNSFPTRMSGLLPGWEAVQNGTAGDYYYWNIATGEVRSFLSAAATATAPCSQLHTSVNPLGTVLKCRLISGECSQFLPGLPEVASCKESSGSLVQFLSPCV